MASNDALQPVGDRWALRVRRRLDHPPETVWRAFVDPELLGRWYPFVATELDARVGGIIRFRDEEGTEVQAEITELRRPTVMALREHDEETGLHELRLELEPDGDGARLLLTHTFADATWAERTEQGWVHTLDALADVLGDA